jgi:2-isopropylmalate synthase
LGLSCIGEGKLEGITELSRYVAELANMAHDERQPFVGDAAFSHKAGMHIDGVAKERRSFEHVAPEAVGNHRALLMSDQAGTRAITEGLKEQFPDLEKGHPAVKEILEEMKRLEHQGYQFEAADASFNLLAQKILKVYTPIIELERFRVLVEKRSDGETDCEAVLKVRVNGRPHYTASTGDGPVNALDNALRKALGEFERELRQIALTDYKVRVLNEKSGTAAKVRVLVDSADNEGRWGTVGVSENIIEASWFALVDSVEYGLRKSLERKQK